MLKSNADKQKNGSDIKSDILTSQVITEDQNIIL